jgi:hypothetical protein
MLPRFLCDEMNGDVARWLRIMGFDCLYIVGHNLDNKLIELCKEEGRILITSDVELSIRASNRGVDCILTNGLDRREKLRKIITIYNLESHICHVFRCPKCNTVLDKIDSHSVSNKIPRYVAENYSYVWLCGGCGKIYWEGSHWKNINNYLKRLLSK